MLRSFSPRRISTDPWLYHDRVLSIRYILNPYIRIWQDLKFNHVCYKNEVTQSSQDLNISSSFFLSCSYDLRTFIHFPFIFLYVSVWLDNDYQRNNEERRLKGASAVEFPIFEYPSVDVNKEFSLRINLQRIWNKLILRVRAEAYNRLWGVQEGRERRRDGSSFHL